MSYGPEVFLLGGIFVDKVFTTTDKQVEKLKSRGMNIADKDKHTIEMENYYNLINGYKELFIDNTYTGDDEKYKNGTNFTEIYALFLFDRDLRSIFLRSILEIENNVKSVLSHDFSKKYGHDNYLKISNFDTRVQGSRQAEKTRRIGAVAGLVANLQGEIARQLSKKNLMISHSMLNYGYVPLWVLVNTLSLGTISIFYSNLIQLDQNDIGRRFNLKPEEMTKLLFVLSIYRNACAHDERLFNLKALKKNMTPNMIKTNNIHRKMNIKFNSSNNPICGKNDLFSIVIIFKIMLNATSFERFYFFIKKAIDEIEKSINTIKIEDILREMGFPSNWVDIKDV